MGFVNKRVISTVSIALLGIGAFSASLIIYDKLANDDLANQNLLLKINDKNEAQKISFEKGSWSKNQLEDKSVTSQLLHIKNDGFTFLVDHDTLEDKNLFMNKFSDLGVNQYVWLVMIQSKDSREWSYLIDAKTGNILQSPDKGIKQFKPVNPNKALSAGSVITQAKGDVTIELAKGITESKSNPFPANLVITVGDKITWENNDDTAHNVASISHNGIDDVGRIFESGIIPRDGSFSFTAGTNYVGQIDYACLLHTWETGSITIQTQN